MYALKYTDIILYIQDNPTTLLKWSNAQKFVPILSVFWKSLLVYTENYGKTDKN